MKDRTIAFAFVGVVLLGALLRLAFLRTIPPGLFFDEAANLFDVERVLQGARPLYFPANNGREPLFFYWAALFAALWGLNAYAIRLAAAALGILTLPATFLCAREVFAFWRRDQRWASWVALAATFALAINYVHLHYSRYGLRTISLPLFLALAFGLTFRGLRRDSWWTLTLAGAFGGLSTYTYLASRLAPALLAIPPLAAALARRHAAPTTADEPLRFRATLVRVAWVALIWFGVSLPLGVYALRHPSEIQGHADDVSILNPANNHGDPVGAALHGIAATLGAFDVAGSQGGEQNLPGRPVLDPVLSLFFLLGLATLLLPQARSEDTPSRLLVVLFLVGWILDQSASAALSVNPPSYVRLSGTLPPLAMVVGLGIVTAGERLRWTRAERRVALGLVGAGLVISTVWTARDYFVVWGRSTIAYSLMMGNKVDAATYIQGLAGRDRVFLAPLYAQDNTFRFILRNSHVDSFDLGQSLVVPTNQSQDVHYLFPDFDADEATAVARELPTTPRPVLVRDPTGRYPLLLRLDLPAASLPAPPPLVATFDDAIGLARPTVAPERGKPGESVAVTLVWFARRRVPEDETVFVHLRDEKNATVAQTDGPPAAGSFPTSAWQEGDLVWDRHRLTIPSSAAPGRYRLVAGLYRLATLRRLEAHTPTGRAEADEVEVGSIQIDAP